jgi:putative zinc finger protein
VTCAAKASLGAYALGALDERERDRVDEHVAACARCREELEALIPVRAYLARLVPEELERVEAPPRRLEAPSMTPGAPRSSRLRHPLLAGGALAALAAAALLALIAWPRGEDASPLAGARSSAVDARTGVRASVAATSRLWGTELRVRMRGAAPGQRCRLIARARDGRSYVAATWWTTYGGSAEVTGAAAIPAADLVALDVVTATGRRLVHVPMNQSGGPT